jgi:hypothetical protein
MKVQEVLEKRGAICPDDQDLEWEKLEWSSEDENKMNEGGDEEPLNRDVLVTRKRTKREEWETSHKTLEEQKAEFILVLAAYLFLAAALIYDKVINRYGSILH